MAKTIHYLKQEFVRIRTSRASPGLVEDIKIEAYGGKLAIKEVASIGCPEPRLIIIKPWDPNLLIPIEKAILQAGIGFNPSNDGMRIKIPIPPLTEERRKEIVKMVHKIGEDSKVAIRNIRREMLHLIKEIKEISKDEQFYGEKEVQKITDKYIKEIEGIIKNKEKEILEE
jgi:ribosome recycling factor